jgi:hypothetical protein
MIARLTVHLPRQPTKTLLARQPATYVVGRDPSCDLTLDDARVSRRHARLAHSNGEWVITDLGSKNGVSLDGSAIDEAALDRPCWLSFGGLMGRFEPLGPDSPWFNERSRRFQSSLDARRRLDSANQEVEDLVQRLLGSVLEITRAERGFVLLANGEDLEVVGSSGIDPSAVTGGDFLGSSSAVRRVLQSGRPIAESDIVDDSVLAGRPSVIAGGIRGLVCLPLEAADERLGALYVDSTKAGAAFDELDLEILAALTSHAALALWIASVDRELHGLTGRLPTAFARRREEPGEPPGAAPEQGGGEPRE